jgi:hypothetical protein
MNGFNQAIDRSGSSCLTVREWLEWGQIPPIADAFADGELAPRAAVGTNR